VQGRRLARVLLAGAGESCRRRARLASLEAIAASSRQLVAIGAETADGRRRLYRVGRRGLTRLGSNIGGTDPDPLAVVLAGERPVFVADSPQNPSLRQLFIAGKRAPVPLPREGDATPVGDVHFAPSDVFAGPAGNDVLVTSTVRGGGARRALVVQSLPR